ncbi:MAG: beta-glucosidase-like glycosyl hydrolase [Mucilaginibacter sp.]|uniref:glycoside hydrolase family 3 C-terminal domain-containing protein n=1 Tax=Mucilaginibacter sp. TaxID=1882438 RepID=UPI002604053C|nr:glycoside hydrolase family 3 C-terminal domain-containing protein [Mucilaginibacter sp.]MDB5005084.1 beta-glucosidase-like glycosyl hydrolase [Mucilaginibacter sp.]
MKVKITLLFALLSVITVSRSIAQTADKPLYLDYTKPVEERVKDLISRMTLEEKAEYLNHVGPDIPKFGIKSDKWNQSLHGVVWTRPTTMFPVSIAMAATWDTKLVHTEATAISDEARAIYNGWHNDPNFQGEKKGLIYRSPVINISRNPYWGRINECFGEDPFLTGRIGVAHVTGLQGNDPKYLKLVSTLKHYAVNNVEQNRTARSATVSERMLHEFWLPHFKDCIVEGGAQSIMASYNAINGVPNNINHMMLTDILKNRWGFKGFVVSDLGGVNTMVNGHEKGKMSYEEAVAQSINAGCDFSDKEFMQYIPIAVNKGLLTMAKLDESVSRVMRDRFLLGEFDPQDRVPYSKIPMSVIGNAEHVSLALKAAQEAMVLLTNKNHILPLDKNKIKTIAVIGPHANMFTAGGYSGKPIDAVNPMQGIKNRMATGTEIIYAAGSEITHRRNAPEFNKDEELQKAVDAAKKADVAILYIGTTLDIEAEGRDRTSLELPGNQEELVKAVLAVNPRTIVVLMNAGPLTIPYIKDNAPAILEAWWPGEQGGNAIADALFGNINPGGKMPLTVYASAEQVPSQDEYDVTKGFTYMYVNGKPLFPFGHGLSYTTFNYSNLKLSAKQIKDSGAITVSVDVKNSGKVTGDEVVQLYIHDVSPSLKRPNEELRGFERITLAPGQTKTVKLTIPGSKLAFYDEKIHDFRVEPEMIDVMVGSSSADIRLKSQFRVTN